MRRKLYVGVRLFAASLAWFGFASMVALARSRSGAPSVTEDTDRAWRDLRAWAMNPEATSYTPEQRVNLIYGLGQSPFVFNGGVIALFTRDRQILLLCGAASLLLWTLFIRHYHLKKAALGHPEPPALTVLTFVLFPLYYWVAILMIPAWVSIMRGLSP